jgi:carboxypeptidase C (cathepsin A)
MMFSKSLLLAAVCGVAFAADENDRVLSMPDFPEPFNTYPVYSGYLNIDASKSLHYMLIESQKSPSTDPLIIWFNGGPGCSSMLGFTQEHGPYKLDSGETTWTKNDYSWNREANMLYIESPAGVGYSICTGVKECNTYSDPESATDNLAAVLAFFTKFPEFKTNDLYISGESYAGIYVPYLTKYIDDYNTQNAADPTVFKPNLKGFMVGNGVTNYTYDCTPAYVEMGYWHSLYNTQLYDDMQAAGCNYGGYPMNTTSECIGYL